MMTTNEMLSAIGEMPAFATTAARQIGVALDDIISAADPATRAAAQYVRGRITVLLAPRGKHGDFLQLVNVIAAVRERQAA